MGLPLQANADPKPPPEQLQLEIDVQGLPVRGRGYLGMGQGDGAHRRQGLRAADQANAGARCGTATHLEIQGIAGLAGRGFDSTARHDLYGHKHECAAASCKCGRPKKNDGTDDRKESNQQPPSDGPATNLIRVTASIEHEPRKSRIRALARESVNYRYLFGLIAYNLLACRNCDVQEPRAVGSPTVDSPYPPPRPAKRSEAGRGLG